MARFTRSRAAASWLLNLNNTGEGILNQMSRPAELFGITQQGIRGQQRLAFGGYSLSPGAGGRWWIPEASNTAAKAGRWGTRTELGAAMRATPGATGGLRLLGKAFLVPLLSGLFIGWDYNSRRNEGQGRFGALAGAVGSQAVYALGMRALIPIIANPIALAVAAPLAIGLGAIYLKNKYNKFAKNWEKTARKTEFIGDMSAFNTGAANTMRQRSEMAIRRSFLNARTALGNETRFEHMPHMYGNSTYYGY